MHAPLPRVLLPCRRTVCVISRAVAVLAVVLVACSEPVAVLQNGRTRAPLDSAFSVFVLSDRATTFELPAPPGTGVWLDVNVTGGPARVAAGDAATATLSAEFAVDPAFGTVRSATVPAGPTGVCKWLCSLRFPSSARPLLRCGSPSARTPTPASTHATGEGG